MSQWRLPDNLEDLLPAKASKLESMSIIYILGKNEVHKRLNSFKNQYDF